MDKLWSIFYYIWALILIMSPFLLLFLSSYIMYDNHMKIKKYKDQPYVHRFVIQVEKLWTDCSIGLCFSICPKLDDGKREIYLILELFRICITIGFMRVYFDPLEEERDIGF